MPAFSLYISIFTLLSVFSSSFADLPIKKFEYKHSFKGPHLVQTDGTLPFWEYGGDAIASDDSIRITPSMRSKKGFVWNKLPYTADNWEIEVVFRVTGTNRVGADGLAVWFTSEKGTLGPVFGSNDKWDGLAIIMDSFDNDAQNNNPYISVVLNDKTKMFDHPTDGLGQHLAGCMRDFRNKPYPVRIKIEYYNKGLSMFVNNGMTNKKDEYDLCMRAENIELPKTGYFGVTAATGGLADDHDVFSFLTHTLYPPEILTPDSKQFTDEDKAKYDKEFEDYHEKLQKARNEYQKEHPKLPGDLSEQEIDDDKWFETQNARELKQIFDGQSSIDEKLRLFGTKIDEIVGRQERILSQLTLVAQSQGVVQPSQGAGGVPVDTIKREEVNQLLNSHTEMSHTLNNIRGMVTDLAAQRNEVDKDNPALVESIRLIQDDVRNLVSLQEGGSTCPTTNCLSTSYFMFFIVSHLVVVIGYLVYRSNKEAQAKKFY